MPRKTTKGDIYYKPLKMALADPGFLGAVQAKPGEGVADSPVKENTGLGFPLNRIHSLNCVPI